MPLPHPRPRIQHEQPDATAVEADLEPMLIGPAAQRFHLEDIVGIERELIADRRAAARSERQAVEAHVLRKIGPQTEGLRRRRDGRIANGDTADLAGRGHVAIQERRRHFQDAGDVVEAVAHVVGRENGRDIDVEREEVSNRVLVLGAIQPMDGLGSTGIGAGRRVAIDLALEPRGQRVRARLVGPWPAGRRHRAGSQLPNDFFPRLCVGRNIVQAGMVQHQTGDLRLLVVAADAVAIEECALRRGAGRRRSLGRVCRYQRRPNLPLLRGRVVGKRPNGHERPAKRDGKSTHHHHRVIIPVSDHRILGSRDASGDPDADTPQARALHAPLTRLSVYLKKIGEQTRCSGKIRLFSA